MTTEQTAGTDLHTRIREALEERIRLAERAWQGNGWRRERADEVWTGESKPGHTPIPVARCWDAPTADFITANDPATTIRRAERDLRLLDRHAPKLVRYVGGLRNVECACGETDPCVEVRELAAGEGIQP